MEISRRSIKINIPHREIIVHFDKINDDGKIDFQMNAFETNIHGNAAEPCFHATYNRDFETETKFDAAFKRYSKRGI